MEFVPNSVLILDPLGCQKLHLPPHKPSLDFDTRARRLDLKICFVANKRASLNAISAAEAALLNLDVPEKMTNQRESYCSFTVSGLEGIGLMVGLLQNGVRVANEFEPSFRRHADHVIVFLFIGLNSILLKKRPDRGVISLPRRRSAIA